MNIFYNIKSLNDALVGVVTTEDKIITKQVGTDVAFFDAATNALVGFNIFNVSNELKVAPGRVYITESLRKFISKRLGLAFTDVSNEIMVGKIIECIPIENTHLFKCRVDVGNTNILDIVSGAQNARLDLLVVVANTGAAMPSGLVIRSTVLRGHQSNGMLCSQRELNITGFNTTGVIELDSKKFKAGDLFKNAYNSFQKNGK